MFAPYTPLDRAVGQEVVVWAAGREVRGILAGFYRLHEVPYLVLVAQEGTQVREVHVPVAQAVVERRAD